MTVPKYRENSLVIPFNMLCPGISQNSKHHHLTLYNGQVWEEISYLELCNHNVLNIVYGSTANWEVYPMEMNGELHVPTLPGIGFIYDNSQVPCDSEMLQSFAKLTNTTNIILRSLEADDDGTSKYNILVGKFACEFYYVFNHDECLPPTNYEPWYIWTKYPPQGSRIANIFGLFDSSCWALVILTWLTLWYTFKLLEHITDRMGYCSFEEELPFFPFG